MKVHPLFRIEMALCAPFQRVYSRNVQRQFANHDGQPNWQMAVTDKVMDWLSYIYSARTVGR